MGDNAKGNPNVKHKLVWFTKRSTPMVLPADQPVPGKDERPEGYGDVEGYRKCTEDEEKQIARGDWVRISKDGSKPGDPNYKRSQYRPQQGAKLRK